MKLFAKRKSPEEWGVFSSSSSNKRKGVKVGIDWTWSQSTLVISGGHPGTQCAQLVSLSHTPTNFAPARVSFSDGGASNNPQK
jgi:hypothetical protein